MKEHSIPLITPSTEEHAVVVLSLTGPLLVALSKDVKASAPIGTSATFVGAETSWAETGERKGESTPNILATSKAMIIDFFIVI